MTKPVDWPPNNPAILDAIHRLFESGNWWIYKGEAVRDFEQRFAEAHGCRFGISVCNATVALDVILRALGIGPGDRVILPAYDYYSLPKSVANVGAGPLFADVCRQNPTLDVDQVRALLGPEVKAVVAAHLSGSVAQIDALADLCAGAGIPLIEDCAQAHGATYGGRRVGSWGMAGLFSFGGIKLMTCGQGGMITTSDPALYEKCYAIVNRGRTISGQYNHYGIIGDNYQLSELAATVLAPQLDTLEELCVQREAIMRRLDREIERIEGIAPMRQFEPTTCRAQMRYTFTYAPRTSASLSRDQLVSKAQEAGILLMPGHRCVSDDAGLFHAFAGAGE
jgi:dTDP-4-amino-4,6-dideoxygalactose transaminase